MPDITTQDVEEIIDNRLTNTVNALSERIESEKKRAELDKKVLSSTLRILKETGIAYASMEFINIMSELSQHKGLTIRQYMDGWSRTLYPNRAMIYAERSVTTYYSPGKGHVYEDSIIMKLTKNTRYENIVSGFLLLAGQNHPNIRCETVGRKWQFMFINKEGHDLFYKWLDVCRTNKIYQIVLR